MFAAKLHRTLRQATLALLMAGSAGLAAAGPAPVHAYRVDIDTSSFSGAGFLDFALISGNSSAPGASATLSHFSGAFDTLISKEDDVGGLPPSRVTFGNASFYNDLFYGVTLGGKFSFEIQFGGAFLTTPGNAGTTFGVGLLNDTSYLGNPDGNVVQFELMPLQGNGSAGITAAAYGNVASISAVPEASAWLMMAGGIALVGFSLRRRQLNQAA